MGALGSYCCSQDCVKYYYAKRIGGGLGLRKVDQEWPRRWDCSYNIAQAVFPFSASQVQERLRIAIHQGRAVYSAIPCERTMQTSRRQDWELACTLSTAEWGLKPLSCCKNNPNLIGRERHHPSNHISKGVSACNPILCRGWFHKYVLRQPAMSRPSKKTKRGLGWG